MPAGEAKADRDRVLDLFPELAGRLDELGVVAVRRPAADAGAGPGADEQARLLLIDELSFGLAPRIVRDLFQVVSDLRETGVTFLIVEQQAAALKVSDRTYILRGGRNVLSRDSAELLDSDELAASYLR